MWSDSENGENKNICKTCEAPLTVQKRTERASKKEACERNEAIKVKTIKMKHGINNAAAVAGVGHSRMGFHPPCSIAKIGFAQRNACSAFNLRHINIRTKGLECSLGSPAVDRLLGLVFLSFIQKKLIIRVSHMRAHMHAHAHVPRLLLVHTMFVAPPLAPVCHVSAARNNI